MKTSIEIINGKECTVIRKPFDAEWVREQLSMGVPVAVAHLGSNAVLTVYSSNRGTGRWVTSYAEDLVKGCDIESIITILPPLPKHPTSEDTLLLYRYMAEGLTPVLKCELGNNKIEEYPVNHEEAQRCLSDSKEFKDKNGYKDYITHAVDADGNRVDVAIKEV